MKIRNKIWQTDTAAYKRFQFPVHEDDSKKNSKKDPVDKTQESTIQDQALAMTGVDPYPSINQEKKIDSFETEKKLMEEQYAVELQKIEKESYQRGYEEGRRLGFDEASTKVNSQKPANTEGYTAFIKSFKHQLELIQTQNIQDREQLSVWLGQVVEEVCRQVVRNEVTTQQGHIVEVIRQSLELIPKSNEYAIHVSSKDADFLRDLEPDLGIQWQLKVNKELDPGDCRIVANDSEANANLESRLIQCLDIIRESLPSNLEAMTA